MKPSPAPHAFPRRRSAATVQVENGRALSSSGRAGALGDAGPLTSLLPGADLRASDDAEPTRPSAIPESGTKSEVLPCTVSSRVRDDAVGPASPAAPAAEAPGAGSPSDAADLRDASTDLIPIRCAIGPHGLFAWDVYVRRADLYGGYIGTGSALPAEPSTPAPAGTPASDPLAGLAEARAVPEAELPRCAFWRPRCPGLGAARDRAAAIRLPLVHRQWRKPMEPVQPQSSRWSVRHPASLPRVSDGDRWIRLADESHDAGAVDGGLCEASVRVGVRGEGVPDETRVVLSR